MTFGFGVRNNWLKYQTIQYLDPWPLSVLFINHFSNTLICYTQCHAFGLFFSHTFCTLISFGFGPSLLAQMSFMAWQRETFEVSGPWWGAVKAESLERHSKCPTVLKDNSTFPFCLSLFIQGCYLYKIQAPFPIMMKMHALYRGNFSPKSRCDTP